ncbi:transposase [Trichonephila clavipes]|nr:transposase [Trichonephila clavipes]
MDGVIRCPACEDEYCDPHPQQKNGSRAVNAKSSNDKNGIFIYQQQMMDFFQSNGDCKNLKQAKVESNYLVWNKKVPDTELEKFKKIIQEKYNLKFHTYWDLHSWSVINFPSFWEELWNYLKFIISKHHDEFGLELHQNDHQARRRFLEWSQNEIAVVPDFHKRILFSDEAHFWLNGYVNKQNCRIWSEANPQVYVETPLHPEKLTVWCALWAGGIIGPYFFKNDEGHNVTVNGDRYRVMITNFFIPELNNHDVQELWFQQDCATCHTARATIDLLKDTFGDRLISRFGPVNWPPRSCDLSQLDYFLWGYVK